jgi:hypothetical protein
MKRMGIVLMLSIALISFSEAKDVILDTSFEEYDVGSLPRGFRIKYDGRGRNYQIVVDKKAFRGKKSFQVWGQPGWCANIHYDFNVFKHNYVEVSWKMFTTEDNNGWISFINEKGESWGWGYCGIGFSHKDGTYRICFYDEKLRRNVCKFFDSSLIPVKPNSWNTARIILNTRTAECTAYLNGHRLYDAKLDTSTGWIKTTYYFLDGSVRTYKYKKNNPKAYYGLHGIRLGDCAGMTSIGSPTYFDDLRIVGYESFPMGVRPPESRHKICLDVRKFPREAKKELIDFYEFLKQKYTNHENY